MDLVDYMISALRLKCEMKLCLNRSNEYDTHNSIMASSSLGEYHDLVKRYNSLCEIIEEKRKRMSPEEFDEKACEALFRSYMY